MHLLAARPGGYSDENAVVRIDQTPADIVFLSTADTDLALLAGVYEKKFHRAKNFPTLRLAGAGQLRNAASVDLYVEEVAGHAQVVVASLLGGAAYWPYLCGQLAALGRGRGRGQGRGRKKILLVPGDDQPDPALAGFCTADPAHCHRVWRYLRCGGAANAESLLQFLAAEFFAAAVEYAEPRPLPAALVHHPRRQPAGLGDWRREWRAGAPVAAVVFYRAHLQAANTAAVDALCAALCAAGVNPLPLAVTSLKDAPALAAVNQLLAEAACDVVVNTTGFGAGAAAGEGGGATLFARDVPVLQVILAGNSRAEWEGGQQGLAPRDVAMNVALPEVDGRIITRAVSFKDSLGRCEATQSERIVYRAHEERMNFVAQLAKNWCGLGGQVNREKRIALVLANYPTRDGRIGNGVGLDTPQSTVDLLRALQKEKYAVADIPADGDALIRALLAGPTNDPDTAALRACRHRVPLAEYEKWFGALPQHNRAQVLQRWGNVGDDPMATAGAMRIAGRMFGGTFVGIQPARGYHLDAAAVYHDPDLVPTHSYLAFYFWLRKVYGASAILHVGKHGNLEWLPGKSIALSENCWPDLIFGPTPHVYPFIVNDPGEGAQAKRRAQAVIVDHLVPPLTRAEVYGALAELEARVDEYYDALTLDPRRADALREEIVARIREQNLHREFGLGGEGEAGEADELLRRADAYLCELKESQIRDGLHIFGRSPKGRQRIDTLLALLRAPRGDGRGRNDSVLRALARDFALGEDYDPLTADPAAPWPGPRPAALAAVNAAPWRTAGDTRERLELFAAKLISGAAASGVATITSGVQTAIPETETVISHLASDIAPRLDACGAAETDGVLRALGGRFVAAGPSGAPSRGRVDVLPTGRNFYSVDVRAVPTPTAWRLGFHAAELLVERYAQDHGEYPRAIGMSAWGTAAMRTGGDDIAQALALLGVRPKWSAGTNRVCDFEIMPLSALGRPRVDVTLRVSGFFRDAFSNVIDFFDAAVRAVAGLEDESAGDNPLRAKVLAEAGENQKRGMDLDAAMRAATYRVFGAKPGAYGAGLQGAIDERCWQTRADLARAYINWGGYAYGQQCHGAPAFENFRARLGAVQGVLHNQDNREHDILDSDDYYQFHGGLAAAAETVGGKKVALYHGDHALTEAPRIRSLKEELSRVLRSRAVNPKWLAGVKRHGYKGAFEIAATVDYLFAYDATTGVVDDYQYAMLTDAYLLDHATRDFIREHNPHALREIGERLLEAMQRGMWKNPGDYRGKVEEVLLLAEEGVEG